MASRILRLLLLVATILGISALGLAQSYTANMGCYPATQSGDDGFSSVSITLTCAYTIPPNGASGVTALLPAIVHSYTTSEVDMSYQNLDGTGQVNNASVTGRVFISPDGTVTQPLGGPGTGFDWYPAQVGVLRGDRISLAINATGSPEDCVGYCWVSITMTLRR